MSKQLKDWLDEFIENGANPENVTDWPENAGGGGITEVEELPLLGKNGAIYQTEDGSIYTCRNVKGKGFIAGKSYMPKSVALGSDFSQIENDEFFDYHNTSNIGIAAGYALGQKSLYLAFGKAEGGGLVRYKTIIYTYDPSTPESTEVIPTLQNMEQIEPFTFTTEILRAALNQNFDINKIASLFTNPDDIEYSIYTKVSNDGIDISPFVCFKAGAKIKVDFSAGSYEIDSQIGDYPNSIMYESLGYVNDSGDPVEFNPGILLVINEARTQILALFQDTGSYNYQTLSNSVVIYDGPALSNEINYTSDIDYAWPTVEFTADDNLIGTLMFVPYCGYTITN